MAVQFGSLVAAAEPCLSGDGKESQQRFALAPPETQGDTANSSSQSACVLVTSKSCTAGFCVCPGSARSQREQGGVGSMSLLPVAVSSSVRPASDRASRRAVLLPAHVQVVYLCCCCPPASRCWQGCACASSMFLTDWCAPADHSNPKPLQPVSAGRAGAAVAPHTLPTCVLCLQQQVHMPEAQRPGHLLRLCC